MKRGTQELGDRQEQEKKMETGMSQDCQDSLGMEKD